MKKIHKISIGTVITLAALLSSWVIIHLTGLQSNETKQPAVLLDPGWQFYSKPTTLEPPGTVFRIDANGRKYIVEIFGIVPLTGSEVIGRTEQIIETEARVLARFIGKVDPEVCSSGTMVEKLRFEMIDTEREVTTDKVIDDVLQNFVEKVRYRKDNRYFVIREARSATELHYALAENIVHQIGGEDFLNKLATAQGNFYQRKGKEYILKQKLPKRMRVMFLPEEIVMVGAPLSGGMPEFGTVPVREVLTWND